jgi:hypothetical protein
MKYAGFWIFSFFPFLLVPFYYIHTPNYIFYFDENMGEGGLCTLPSSARAATAAVHVVENEKQKTTLNGNFSLR